MFLRDHKKTALVWKDIKISYQCLMRNVNYYSSLFDAGKDSKVAIFSENRPEWIFTFYAGWKNGAVMLPIDFMATYDEVAYMLNDARPETIFTSKERKKVLVEALNEVSYSPKIVVFEEIVDKSDDFAAAEVSFRDKKKTALILYTSGTTGDPKGVMLSYENILTNVEAVSIGVKYYEKDSTVLLLLPLHHIFPIVGALITPLYVGGTIAAVSSMAGSEIIDTLQKNGVTVMIGVPRFYAMIHKGIMEKIKANKVAAKLFFVAKKLRSKTFSRIVFKAVHKRMGGCVKFLISGGAALPKHIGVDLDTLGFNVQEGYGMTEAAPMISFPKIEKNKLGSVGQVIEGAQVKIVEGEITVKGPNVMKGYYKRDKETADVIKDGWLYTGDLGYFDDEGFLYITGRKKEIIVLPNGKNVNPEELENKLSSYSDKINEVGVYLKGEFLNAVIVPDSEKLKADGIEDSDEYFKWEVIDKFNKTVTPYKKIIKFSISLDDLPRTRLGKLRRFMLETMEEGTKEGGKKYVEPDFEEYGIVKEFVEKATDCEVFSESHLEMDLGMDSLDKVTLQANLNNSFGLNLTTEQFEKLPTVIDLAEYVKENKHHIRMEDMNWSEILHHTVPLELPISNWYHGYLKKSAWMFLKTYFRVSVSGRNHLPKSPFIIAPNHQSFIDGLFVGSFLSNKVFKNSFFIAKTKHIVGIRKYVAERSNIITVDVSKDLKLSLQKMAAVLNKGKNVVIFPEGTRSRDGKLGNFKKTFAILSKELNIPVVPVVIQGAYDALPRGSYVPKPLSKIEVRYLPPIYPKDMDYDQIAESVRGSIEKNFKKIK